MGATLPRELLPVAKLLEKGEPLLVVVGAGVSIGATDAPQASWLGLLKHGVQHLIDTGVYQPTIQVELNGRLDAAFSPFNLEAALEQADGIQQTLLMRGKPAFAGWLEKAFGDFRVPAERAEVLDALGRLEEAGALLLTTNYDSVLSDATGLPPVTWEEHADFYRVSRRQQRGILHVHGHWQRPSSIVLGSKSYERIGAEEDIQKLLSGLWLYRSWIYVGCGDGLGDPNLGRLLEWGKGWPKDADYFLARQDVAYVLDHRAGKPANLVCVGYRDHADLGGILRELAPDARRWPFVRIDESFELFRTPASSIPFPSREEYLDRAVPSLEADAEVERRLETHGWAFILGVASVGKTTLAVRIATSPKRSAQPTFYLDLSKVDADDVQNDVSQTLRRLSHLDALFILDNVQYQPELARQLWNQWRERPGGSHLLLVGTRTERSVTTAPAQDLSFFEHHVLNPAVELRPTQKDLAAIVRHLYKRVVGESVRKLPAPPEPALKAWHRDYGSALGAFCLAALDRLAEFDRGHWDLPFDAASDWVRVKWLKRLDAQNTENLLCLAVHGEQDLELLVPNEALPYPGKIEQLLSLGLVAKTERGRFGQYHRYSLREPGWGGLLLAALPPVNHEQILFETAARYPMAAQLLTDRLRAQRSFDRLDRLWAHLAAAPQDLQRLMRKLSIGYVPKLAKSASDAHQPLLAQKVWEAFDDEAVVEQLWQTPLGGLTVFLKGMEQFHRDSKPLWDALESERDREQLFERVREASPGVIIAFFDAAKRHQRDMGWLWDAIEREPGIVAEQAWQRPLSEIASCLEGVKRHGRNPAPFWAALEKAPEKLLARAWESALEHLASFFDIARQHGRETTPLWEAIEREPAKFAVRAWTSSMEHLGHFLNTARLHRRDPAPMWDAIESDPEKLAACAMQTPLGHVSAFLNVARLHKRNTAILWSALERDRRLLAEIAVEAPLPDLSSFLHAAQVDGRDMDALWSSLEDGSRGLASRATEAPLGGLAQFLHMARELGRDASFLWSALEQDRLKLAERVRGAPIGELAAFLDAARKDGRDVEALWLEAERAPNGVAERIVDATIVELTSYLTVAHEQGRDMDSLWSALEKEPEKVVSFAVATPLNNLSAFFRVAQEQQRDVRWLEEAMGRRDERIAELGRDAAMGHLAGFCHFAPDSLVRLALSGLEPSHWDGVPQAQSLVGGDWVATRCAEVGRTDLRDAILTTLLRRKNWRDFPPQSMALAGVAWVLKMVPEEQRTLVPAFLRALCTERWLTWQYANAGCSAIAAGLWLLALEQPAQVRRLFVASPSLPRRLQAELARFSELSDEERSLVIQLLGCARLVDVRAKREWLANVAPAAVASLPVQTLPHAPDAAKIEERQYQLWLGLRAFIEAAGKPLAVPSSLIHRTLELWRANAAETSAARGSAEHRVNLGMVEWLASCVRAGR